MKTTEPIRVLRDYQKLSVKDANSLERLVYISRKEGKYSNVSRNRSTPQSKREILFHARKYQLSEVRVP